MGIHYIQLKDNSGRLVIPKPIRDALDVGSGTLLLLTQEGKNRIILEKVAANGVGRKTS